MDTKWTVKDIVSNKYVTTRSSSGFTTACLSDDIDKAALWETASGAKAFITRRKRSSRPSSCDFVYVAINLRREEAYAT